MKQDHVVLGQKALDVLKYHSESISSKFTVLRHAVQSITFKSFCEKKEGPEKNNNANKEHFLQVNNDIIQIFLALL